MACPTPISERMAGMRAGQGGFSYLLLLFAVAALGIAAAGSSVMWSTLSQTERERELLFIGGEFARALQRYYDASPVEPKSYPSRLEDLLEDKRHQVPVRHLRKLYIDPFTRRADWATVMVGGQIRAVHSRSEKVARIQVLPPWVDAGNRSDGVPSPVRPAATVPGQTVVRAVTPAQLPRTAAAGDTRHADWLFVPVASAPTGDAGSSGGAVAPVVPGAGGSPAVEPALPPRSRGAD
jgi:hypothetical protein